MVSHGRVCVSLRARQVGFLAQEVELVLPELVSTAPDGFKGIAYARLAPVLTSAVAALASHADALTLHVQRLEDDDAAQQRDAAERAAQEARLNAAEASAAASSAAVEALTARLATMEALMEALLLGQRAEAA